MDNFKTEPFPHQTKYYFETRDLPSVGIGWEMGCGKTKLGIDTLCHLRTTNQINRVLVVAPGGVQRNWITDELPKHMWSNIQYRAMFYESSKASTQSQQKELIGLTNYPQLSILSMSYDAIITKRGGDAAAKFIKKQDVLMICDESHAIKNPKAKRTRFVISASKHAKFRRVLTGTPLAQGPFDIYAQIKFLDPDFWKRLGFRTYTVFKNYFGSFVTNRTKDGHRYETLIAYRNLDELKEIIASIFIRLTKDDVLNLPPKLYQKRYFDLTAEQKRLYKQLKEELMLEIGDNIMDGSAAIVRLLRMQQITSGYFGYYDEFDLDDQGRPQLKMEIIEGKNPRLEALLEIIEEAGEKQGIIWARFSQEITVILDRLKKDGYTATRYDGKISSDEAFANQDSFKKGEKQFIVANAAKGAEGLTWHCATLVVYYSNDVKLVKRLQSEDRAHRIGTTQPVLYIDLIANRTCDAKIVKALRERRDIAQDVMGDEITEWI